MPYTNKSEAKDVSGEIDSVEGENVWANILAEVQSSSQTKLPSSKTAVVLGDNETGKTTLMAKLQGVEDPKKGSGLEFTYINVKDEYRDDSTRLSTWLVDGDIYHRGLLKFALTEQNYAHCCVLLVASLDRPWDIMDSLTKWSDVLSTHIQRLKLPPGIQKQQEDIILREFVDYVERDETTMVTSTTSAPHGQHGRRLTDADSSLSTLEEGTLVCNLGIPIVVVLTRSDAIQQLEKDNEYKDEHFDFIQQHVRKFCLKFGAALFYTSAKDGKNCSLLHKYLVHRLYGFPFTGVASVIEKDSVFIPSGWDNEKKIAILYDGMNNMRPDDNYNDIITKPVVRKSIQREVEISADDEQVFLLKIQGQIAKQPVASAGGTPTATQRESPVRLTSPAGPAKPTMSPRAVSAAGAAATPMKKDAAGGKLNPATNDTGVLANFFNSLLSKNKTSPAAGGGVGDGKIADQFSSLGSESADAERIQSPDSTTTQQLPQSAESPTNDSVA